MDYYLKSFKKFTFIFSTFFILGCSNQVTISEDSYVIKNISIIDPIDGLQSTKSVVITDNIITKILDDDNEFIADNKNIIDGLVLCIEVYEPVCGCNGITYPNVCYASSVGGVTSFISGPCVKPD